jgi:molybdate transport system substrate-binding protein
MPRQGSKGTSMTSHSHTLPALGLCLALGLGTACGDDTADETATDEAAADSGLDGAITVFAAASLTDAFTEAADAFSEENPGVTVELNAGASTALREQILAGAPADVFASANPSNMDQVVEAGEVEGEPEVFAHNSLEIAVPAGNPADVEGLADFADDRLLIGLCAADVPCGEYGREALDQAGVTPAQDTDEPDVRSLLTKIEAGELDAGIVYRTDVASTDGVEGIEIAEEDNVVADYPIAVLANAGEPDIAAAFVEFVLSDDGQAILESHGFDPA